ncbi:MAG: ABC transporter permease [Phycisphaeraceae bacterium]
MIAPRYIPLILKQIIRRPARTLLTLGGVAVAMFLFVAVQSMQRGVAVATEQSAEDNTLVVYREDRYCPFTSKLPEYYLPKIEQIAGVKSVTPMKVIVNNCRASLDVVTFRGVPKDNFIAQYVPHFTILEGSAEEWGKRSDAALLGETLARRRGLKIGDRFDAAGVVSYVAGIVRSDEPQDQNVAYVHLDFLQQTVDRKLGIVTQFNVKVDNPRQMTEVAAAIDEAFRFAESPTATRSEKAFVAQAASDIIELVGFAKYLGWGCLVAVLALVGNAIVLAVQDRIKEHAILQTLGYNGSLLGRLIITEGVALGLVGGALGTLGALGVIEYGQYSLSIDGLSIPIQADITLLGMGLLIAVGLGIVAGLVPAWQASRRTIATCFRAV